jgi:sulfonate transport system substrate-binding protein
MSWGGIFITLASELSGRAAGVGVVLATTCIYVGSSLTLPLFGHLADVTGSYTSSCGMLILWWLVGTGWLAGLCSSARPPRPTACGAPGHLRCEPENRSSGGSTRERGSHAAERCQGEQRSSRAREALMRCYARGAVLLCGAISLLVGGTAWGVQPAKAAAPVTIRMAYTVPELDLLSQFTAKTDILKHYGRSYTVEPRHFQGASSMIRAFTTNELDLGHLAYSTFALAVRHTRLDVRILAEGRKCVGPGSFADTWAVLDTSEIQTVADLRGKRIGIDAFGTAADLALRVLLKKHGMVDKKDYQIVEISSAHQDAMLRAGRIHAAYLVQPFWSMARAKGGVRSIFDLHDALGSTQLVFLAGRTEFLTTHPEAVQDFFEDFLRFWQWMLDPTNRAEVVQLGAALTKRPVEAFADWLLTRNDYYRDPEALVDAAMLQRNVDLLYDMGFIQQRLDTGKYLDLSHVHQAKQRLGGQ